MGWLMGTLPETNSSPKKVDGWNITLLLGRPIFRGKPLVSGSVIWKRIWSYKLPQRLTHDLLVDTHYIRCIWG